MLDKDSGSCVGTHHQQPVEDVVCYGGQLLYFRPVETGGEPHLFEMNGVKSLLVSRDVREMNHDGIENLLRNHDGLVPTAPSGAYRA